MQNTFSAGMYMAGGGDFPITMNDCDMSNLKFTLVDSNYHKIKIFNPLYMIIKVDPVKDPSEDISQWNGKLPINVPTALQQRGLQNQPFNGQPVRPNINQYPQLPLQEPQPTAQDAQQLVDELHTEYLQTIMYEVTGIL
jgi:hypothetical protein